MRNIRKVSEMTYKDIADYIQILELDGDDINLLKTLQTVAINYVEAYTGQDKDAYPDFVIAVFVLCQDMWDNRTLYVDKSNVSKVVETILNMHSNNLL